MQRTTTRYRYLWQLFTFFMASLPLFFFCGTIWTFSSGERAIDDLQKSFFKLLSGQHFPAYDCNSSTTSCSEFSMLEGKVTVEDISSVLSQPSVWLKSQGILSPP